MLYRIERKNSIYTGVCEKEATRRRKIYCDCASSLDKPMCGVDFDSKPCASAGMQLAQGWHDSQHILSVTIFINRSMVLNSQ